MANKGIEAARKAYESSAKNLITTVQNTYQIGDTFLVEKGRSIFSGEVVSHSQSWWNNPGRMVVKNLETGKTRKISYTDIVD